MKLFGKDRHNCDDPWDGAPAWDIEQGEMLGFIIERLRKMSKELDDLTARVRSNSVAIDSAVTLINGIADRITAAGVDPVKLTALTDELKAKDDALAAAVLANTPVA